MSLRSFLRQPTLVEWIVIVLVILIGLAVLLPINLDRRPAKPATPPVTKVNGL